MADAVAFDIAAAQFGNAVTFFVATVARTALPRLLAEHHIFGTSNFFNIFSRLKTVIFTVFEHFIKYSHFLSSIDNIHCKFGRSAV